MPLLWRSGLTALLLLAGVSHDGRAQGITATPLAPPPGTSQVPLAAPLSPPAPPDAPAPAAPVVLGMPARPSAALPGATPPPPSDNQPAPLPAMPPPPAEAPDTAQPAQLTPPRGPAAPPPAGDATPGQFTPAPAAPVTWQPAGSAVLQILDKVNAQSATITVKVGSTAQFGPLAIAARACDVTTGDEAANATAFLDITDSHPDSPAFHGWMLESDPSVSMLQHPVYDVRVVGCGA
jgi:hypothetical protein